ncbi:MAG TPA: Gfo/Idh/MocA family oxidoreductase [Acidimicrobiia bacterium]|nr:Gfo/Idh/MocA family oxidoreductase [Acidimicrobiia bacterium]
MRIGIVGCGHIGTVHTYALKQLADASLVQGEVVAAYDADGTRAAKLTKNLGGEPTASLDALLDAVDVVWICTWTAGHLAAVEAAAARNLPVFCEKPLAPTLSACEAVSAALERVPHQVGLVLRYAPVFAAAADIVASGRYGRPLTTNLRDDQYFPIQGMYGSTWRKDRNAAGGGTLIEHSIHDVDVLRWILGDPISVSASTAYAFGYDGIEDLASVRLRYANDSTAQLVSVWHQVLSRGSSRRLEIFCEEAYLWTEDDFLGPLHVETTEGSELVEGLPPEWTGALHVPEVYEKAVAHYASQAKHFLDALAVGGTGARGFPGASEALAAHRIVDAAYRSAAQGSAPMDL